MNDIEKVYEKYMPKVYKYLLSICHDVHLAEELTQETFLRAINSIDDFRGDCKLSVWLCQIGKNLWIYHQNKSKKSIMINTERDELQENSAETEVLKNDERMELYKMIHKLPDITREVIYLRILGEFSFREIGEILNKNENWARVTFYRGKQRMRKEIEDEL